jgi:signal transduction histidine kinase
MFTETLLMSAYGTFETCAEAIKLGASDYFVKPVDTVKLMARAGACLRKYRMIEEGKKMLPDAGNFSMPRSSKAALLESTLFRQVLLSAGEVLQADAGLLFIAEGNDFLVKTMTDAYRNTVAGKTIKISSPVAQSALQNREPRIFDLDSGVEIPFFLQRDCFLPDLSSGLTVPVVSDNNVIMGLFSIVRRKVKVGFSEDDFEKAKVFSRNMVFIIENSRAYAELENAYKKLRETQAQLIHAEKLSAIGRLVSGIAHEINNPLVSVLGNAQLLLDEIPEDTEWRGDVLDIEAGAKRCKSIINDLLGYSRHGDFLYKESDINDILAKALKLTEYQLKKENITVETDLIADLPLISMSSSHIEQVFINIIINAMQAMPGGGTLLISSSPITLKNEFRRSSDLLKEGEETAVISFRDDGIGINKKNLDKITDPFFTTKEIGVGTGLGLSVCQEIITKHHGHIRISSAGPGKGTEVRVFIPLKNPMLEIS